MTITTDQIQRRLDKSSSRTRDNTAQDIINGASKADLKSLDAHAVFLLITELNKGWVSSRDSAAKKTLKLNSQFKISSFTTSQAISTAAQSPTIKGNKTIKQYLTVDTIKRLYKAEDKRIGWGEQFAEFIGYDDNRIGRGQLGKAAFTDILRKTPLGFSDTWRNYTESYFAAARLDGKSVPGSVQIGAKYNFKAPTQYSTVHKLHGLEDFVVSAFLGFKMKRSTKPARSAKDAARFAVALYHANRKVITDAQGKVTDPMKWDLVEKQLRASGNPDLCDYVIEVIP